LKNETALGNPSHKLNLTGAVPLIRHPKAPGGIPRRPKSAWQIFGSDFFKKYREENAGVQVNFAEVYRAQAGGS